MPSALPGRPRIGAALAAAAAIALALPSLSAAGQADDRLWTPVGVAAAAGPQGADARRQLAPGRFRVARLEAAALEDLLGRIPLEGTRAAADAPVTMTLPMPDGRLARFRVEESPVMGPELAAEHPELRTFRGVGLDDPTASARFDVGPAGLHAMVLSASGTVLVEPWSPRDARHHVSFDKRDYRRATPGEFRCLVETGGATRAREASASQEGGSELAPAAAAFGAVRRTYRLAVAATGEYTQHFGGAGNALSAIVTTINRVTGIYERELAVRLSLVATRIYTDPASDPYSNLNPGAMLAENQANLDASLGSSAYDIGHVFGTAAGGIAGLGVTCAAGNKAAGVTGSPNPLGDAFDVDYVAHEIGHQFGANHTFNGQSGACGGGNRSAETAMEPGSGSTIMAYAGICAPQNLQLASDAYFHGKSADEIQAFVSSGGGAACQTAAATGNNPPAVEAGADRTIPRQTPFVLSASGSDPDGDTLAFAWEEFDVGAPSFTPAQDGDADAVRPIFRSFLPVVQPDRVFPSYASILDNAASYGESLPTRGRTMDFRVTARDGRGGVASDTLRLTVSGSAGPFAVTGPAPGAAWGAGASYPVTWNVAGTAALAPTVTIRLSTNGGLSFPIVLASATANDGGETVTAPNIVTGAARIRIEAVNNYFFDVGDGIFRIGPAVSVADAGAVLEGDSGTAALQFAVTVSPTSQPLSVSYTTANGTAVAGADYQARAGTLSFAASASSQTATVAVPVIGETQYEVEETLQLRLTGAGPGVLVAAAATGRIQNDDAPPSVSIGDLSLIEGFTGTRSAVFPLSLSAASGVPAWVSYATADGTARAGSDYVAGSGAVSFAPGTLTRTVTVPVIGDGAFEGDETFRVTLAALADAVVLDGEGVATILDDDGAGLFQFAVAQQAVKEGAGVATVKVTRTHGTAGATVDYVLSDGTARAGEDYGGASSGVLSFAPLQTFRTFTVPIVKDAADEPDETVLLRLRNPLGAAAALGPQQSAVLTISDDDAAGSLQFAAAALSAAEGAGSVVVTVRRTGGAAAGVTVDYAAADGTAQAGQDYTAAAGRLSFGAGVMTQSFSVPLTQDGLAEGVETVVLSLAAPAGGAGLGSLATATLSILDDEAAVELAAPAYTVKEGVPSVVLSVRRTGPLAGAVSVDYATADATATAGSDYTAAAGRLSLPAGVAQRTFTVAIRNDGEVEAPETFTVRLSNASGAALGGRSSATVSIQDNDALPAVQFAAATFAAGEALPRAVVTVRRSGAAGGTVTVDYATGGGTAVAGADYVPAGGTLTLGPGVTTRTFEVALLQDGVADGTRTVGLTLASPSGAVLGTPATATLAIADDEPSFRFGAPAYAAPESAARAVITVLRGGATTGTASVRYAAAAGSATPGEDFTAVSDTLTFGPGVASRTFEVPLRPDGVDEPNETISLSLSSPSGAGLGTPAAAVLTVSDDDAAGQVGFAVAHFSAVEGAGSATIVVTRSGGASGPASVDYATADGSASAASPDYTGVSGTLTFGPGETSKSFTVPLAGDGVAEPAETVGLQLANPVGGLVLGPQAAATLWIVDDDGP